jgi:hypothetical protein
MERPPEHSCSTSVPSLPAPRRHPPELDEDASTALHHAHLAHLGTSSPAGSSRRTDRCSTSPTRPCGACRSTRSRWTRPGWPSRTRRPGRPVPGRRRQWCVAAGRVAFPSTTVPSVSRSVRGPLVADSDHPDATSPSCRAVPRHPRRGTSSARMRQARSPSTRTTRAQRHRRRAVTAEPLDDTEKHALVAALRHEALQCRPAAEPSSTPGRAPAGTTDPGSVEPTRPGGSVPRDIRPADRPAADGRFWYSTAASSAATTERCWAAGERVLPTSRRTTARAPRRGAHLVARRPGDPGRGARSHVGRWYGSRRWWLPRRCSATAAGDGTSPRRRGGGSRRAAQHGLLRRAWQPRRSSMCARSGAPDCVR